jgi:hypothetical protein
MKSHLLSGVKVADEVWIATALLHREHPEAADFSIDEIVGRVRQEGLHKPLRPVVSHCVANRAPNPGRYRMLFETLEGRRRLYRPSDPYHPSREGSKMTPDMDELPSGYRDLLDWYRDWTEKAVEDLVKNDPLLQARGSGKHLWADEHADEYVRRLREGWE